MPAMAAHMNIMDFTGKIDIPDEIAAFGRGSAWRKDPGDWATTLAGQIASAKERKELAEAFLTDTTYIPCGFYSQVRWTISFLMD